MQARIPAGVLALAFVLGGTALVLMPSSRAAFGDHGALKAAVLVAGALLLARGTARGGLTVLELGLAALALAGAASALMSGRDALVSMAALAPCACLPWLVRSTRLQARPRGIAALVVGVACVVSALALAEALGVRWPWAEVRRPQSTLGNRNFVAAYAVMALPLALSMARGRHRAVGIAASVLLGATLGACRCRGAWVAAVAAGCCWVLVAWLRRDRRDAPARTPGWMMAAVAIVPAVTAAAAPWPGLRYTESAASTARRVLEYDQGSGRGRIEQHLVGLAALRDTPLLGVGPGGWESAAGGAAHTLPDGHASAFAGPVTPNSEALRVLVEHGALGALLLAAAFVWLLRASLGAARRGGARAVALPCALVAAGVVSVFDASLGRPEALALCAVIAGLVPMPEAWAPVRGSPLRWSHLAPAMGLVGAACLAATGLRAASHLASLSARPGSEHWSDRQRTSLALFPRAAIAERLAVIEARAGRCDDARSAAAKAASLSPAHWGAAVEVGRCFARQGDGAEAARWQDLAREVEPHLDALMRRAPAPADEAAPERTAALTPRAGTPADGTRDP